ncbi:LuxR C-terminal-related transcriptional regulator, partial [Vibrio alginolyticus]
TSTDYTATSFLFHTPEISIALVQKATLSTVPIIWENELNVSNDFCDSAKDNGLAIGFSNAIHKPNGVSSLFSVCRSHECLTEKELNKISPYLIWVANLAVQILEKVNNEYAGIVLTEILTPREIEILKWTTEGKTANEVAIILGITVRTVTFHITNAVTKLNSCNKTSAVIKAVSLGLLDI